MKYPIYIKDGDVDLLKYEVLSQDFYIRLTRELLYWCEETDYSEVKISRKNKFINLSRTIKGGKIYQLISDDDGFYQLAEHDWHDSNFMLVFRDLDTVEFIEFMCDLFKLKNFEIDLVNDLLSKENASFRFIFQSDDYGVNVYPINEIIDNSETNSHPNIRLLVDRMENAFNQKDYTAVLHTSSNIFETMAKDIIGTESIQTKTFQKLYKEYITESLLPIEIIDYMLLIYKKRNTEPLAGHGSTKEPSIDKLKATTLKELTKAFIKIDYQLKHN